MPLGKLDFDQLNGINYDIPATKAGFNIFTDLVGLSPSIINGSLSLSKDILLSDSIGDGSDLVFVDRYYSKTYGMSIIFIKSSNNRPYIYYKNTGGTYVSEELPAPVSFPAATDWNGVQVDTRFYLQSYSAEKRYAIRFDSDEESFIDIVLEETLLWSHEQWVPPVNFMANFENDQHTFFSLKTFGSVGGSYTKLRSLRFSDPDKEGLYILNAIYGSSVNLSNDYYIFASSTIDPNSIPEERLIATIINSIFSFTWAENAFGNISDPGGGGGYTIVSVNNSTLAGFIDFFCWYYNFIGISNIVGASLFIDEIEYTISDVKYGTASNPTKSFIYVDRSVHFNSPARSHVFRLEVSLASPNYHNVAIPMYGNDIETGLQPIYGDLVSNYTTLSGAIDAYGKAATYIAGLLVIGSPKYENEQYENYLVSSYINNQGLRQPFSFPITNLTALGSKSGTMLLMKEKFNRIYAFTSESIFIAEVRDGQIFILEPIQLNITSKYHITEFLNGFFVFSGYKIWKIGYEGISEVAGINKYLLDNAITSVYLSWNPVDSELFVYIPSTEKIFILDYNRGIWRNWIPELPATFASGYTESGVSYQVALNGNIFSISSKFSGGLLFQCELEMGAFKTIDITEIRINGSFTFSNIRAILTLTESVAVGATTTDEIELEVTSSEKGIIYLYRDESITVKDKKVVLKVFQSNADTVTKFDVYNIEVFGIFEELEGNYPDEVLTTY